MRLFVAAIRVPSPLLTLLKTFIDILALRRGPESIPSSWLVLAVALLLLGVSSFATGALLESRVEIDYALTYAAYGAGLAFYASVVFLSGHAARLLPTLSAIIGCGSLITLLVIADLRLLGPLLGRDVAGIVATLIIFWSVPVEGHIMARAIGQHWFVGIAIAMLAFVMEHGLRSLAGGS